MKKALMKTSEKCLFLGLALKLMIFCLALTAVLFGCKQKPDSLKVISENEGGETEKYSITYHLAGGKNHAENPASYTKNDEVPLKAPTKAGHTFGGWFDNEACTGEAVTKIAKGSTGNKEFWANWIAGEGVKYTVKHLQQNVDNDEYTAVKTEELKGAEGGKTLAVADSYEGFTAQNFEQQTIKADGTTVVEIKYNRNIITLTLDLAGGTLTPAIPDNKITGKFGAAVTHPSNPAKQGYDFVSWNPELPAAFPAKDATHTAVWAAAGNTLYKVQHYKQNIHDTDYTLADTDIKKGATGTKTTAKSKNYEGFTAQSIAQQTIKADGTTIVSAFYDRNTITLTLDLAGGTLSPAIPENKITGKYEAPLTKPSNPSKPGYDFVSWNPELPETFPASDTVYTAQWKLQGDYEIKYHLNGGSNDPENPSGYNIETPTITLKPAIREGYSFGGWFDNEACTGEAVTKIAKGSTGNKEFWAKWAPKTDIPYTVQHLQQNIDNDEYTVQDTENLTGTTETQTAAEAKTYEGFTLAEPVQQQTIKANGTTVIEIKYDRKRITLNLNLAGGKGIDTSVKGKFEAKVTVTPPVKIGYDFAGWDPQLPEKFLIADDGKIYTAQWTAKTDIPYTVQHLQQNIDNDEYTVQDTENLTGTTETQTAAEAKTYEGFTLVEPVRQQVIKGDGTTVIEIKYSRNIITLTLDLAGGTISPAIPENKISGKFGADVTQLENPKKPRYAFKGWNPPLPEKFPAENATYTAQWSDKVIITVKGDERVDTTVPISEEVQIGKTWADIKADITAKVKLTSEWNNGDYGIYEWHLENEEGAVINDTRIFDTDSIIYAVTNYTKFSIPNGKCIIGYRGEKPRGKIIIPADITMVDNSSNGAFENCDGITEVDMSGTKVDWIGKSSFSNCSALKIVKFPPNLDRMWEWAFYDCTSLEEVDLSKCTKLFYIGYAFPGCTQLKTIKLPPDIKGIRSGAFSSCTSLEELDLSAYTKLTDLSGFSGCKQLKTIKLPPDIKEIGKWAFDGCTSLEELDLSAYTKLTSIGEKAFRGCTQLKTIKLPPNIKKIDEHTFGGCTQLKTVKLPPNITEIGVESFEDCTSLEEADLSEYTKLTSIGGKAFHGCTQLKTVKLPPNIESIGNESFKDCTSLEEADLSECTKVTYIVYHFRGCTKLKTVKLPPNITEIEQYAFDGCKNLTSVIFADPNGWAVYRDYEFKIKVKNISAASLNDAAEAATLLVYYTPKGYAGYYWKKD